MSVGAAGPVGAENSAEGGSWGAVHKGRGHGRIALTNELWRNPLEGLRKRDTGSTWEKIFLGGFGDFVCC